MAQKKIHLIFKTHLDIGFTDYAACVRQQYHDQFIPMAIRTGEHLSRENPEKPKFIWTTGAWLIHEYLEQAAPDARRALEGAIDKGIITWHALPFTTHTELLTADLFEAGLGYSRDLDRRFGRHTTGAKMTDVPGHTLGIVPLLARAGIRFFHIGVNSATPPPDVPPVFRWRAAGGAEIVVMYQSDYGATYFPDGMDEGIGFAHTMDNMGPQSIAQAIETHRQMALEAPGADIVASTLSAYGDLLWTQRERFPVVTDEIGDNWIHGVGTAPAKVARFMALRRLYGEWAQQGLTRQREAMGRRLCMVAEHTWGVDIKTFLRDETAWDRTEFETARKSDPRFALTEYSWREQEALIDDAISVLSGKDRDEATNAATLPSMQKSEVSVGKSEALCLGNGKLAFDAATGSLRLVAYPNGAELSADHAVMAVFYESYDAQDYREFLAGYLTRQVHWALCDNGKPGLDSARTALSGRFTPEWLGVGLDGNGGAVSRFRFSGPATDHLGAPGTIETRFRFVSSDTLEVAVCFFDKPANRMPEAAFVTFAPKVDADSWRFHKLGHEIDPGSVVRNGNRQLHAVQLLDCTTLDRQPLRITPLDSPLAGPAEAPFLPLYRGDVSMQHGVRFCLLNNKWGTNFPMWSEGDFMFRFQVSLSGHE